MPTPSVYEPEKPPEELTLGQLFDDWNELRAIQSGRNPPLVYALVWLSALLRRAGELAPE